MDFWGRARSFAEEAAKRSQELSKEAAKRSQQLTIEASKFSVIVTETAKKSKDIIAAEATKKADQIKVEALKRADQIKSLAEGIEPINLFDPSSLSPSTPTAAPSSQDLLAFGVTDDLRQFVKGITHNTFQDFPMEDERELSDVPTVSNVRQDLTEWQERHATLVLLTVKEISKLRYQLCPRVMKERKFWRIYFILVNTHVASYEKKYMEELKQKSQEKAKNDKLKENTSVGTTSKASKASKAEVVESNQQSKTSTSSAEQDLDVFLLGDIGTDDEGPDDEEGSFDDDFDKIGDNSDDEDEKLPSKKE